MIIGIGIDVIDIDRISKTLNRYGERFTHRIYTSGERQKSESRVNRIESYARRFAAKEACAKALGTGFRKGLNFKDIEILNDNLGKPYFRLNKKIKTAVLKNLNVKNFDTFLSISDEKNYSIAFTIIQTKNV